jgi:hypothetical protein
MITLLNIPAVNQRQPAEQGNNGNFTDTSKFALHTEKALLAAKPR